MTYMLNRRSRIAPGQTEKAMQWVQNVTEKVNSVTGLPTRVQQQIFSPEVGGISWTVFAPNLSTLEGLQDKLTQDSELSRMIDQGTQYLTDQRTGIVIGQASDVLSQIGYGNFEQHGGNQSRGGPEYQVLVEAHVVPGQYQRAIQTGQEIAQRVEKDSGSPVLFAMDMTGSYNGVRWLTSHTDVRQMEQAQQKLQESDKFQQLVDQSAGIFSSEPFSTRQSIYRRLLT